MAILLDDEKLNPTDQDQGQTQPSGMAGQQTSSSPLIGSNSNAIAQGTGGSGAPGGGGPGAWTNIQAYLNANKDDNGSAQLLQNKVQGQFDTEKKTLQEDAAKVRTQAESEAKKIEDAKKSSGQWIDQAGQAYDWGGNKTQSYNDTISKAKSALNGQYSGPKSYNYALGSPTVQYGSMLGANESFDQFMGDLYKEKAGGQLSGGGRALQTQLDVNNVNLANTRDQLMKQYAGLGDLRNQVVTDTTNALAGAEKQFRTNQNAFRDFLSNRANELDTAIAKQEADARAKYASALNTSAGVNNNFGPEEILTFKRAEEDLARWNDYIKGDLSEAARNSEDFRNMQARANSQQSALDNFYAGQNSLYTNTADAEERRWNAIMEMLGQNARKQQGFKVRG